MVEISGISDSLDPDSPRVSGLDEDGDARLFDVACDVAISKAPRGRGSQNAEELRRLRARREVMEVECRLRQREADLLDDAASILARRTTFRVNDLNDLLKRKSLATNAALLLVEEIAELDREVWLLDRKRVGKSEVVISVTLFARRGCQTAFQLRYCEWLERFKADDSTHDRLCSGGRRELEPSIRSSCVHYERQDIRQHLTGVRSTCHPEDRRGLEQRRAHAKHGHVSGVDKLVGTNALSYQTGGSTSLTFA